ncbi:MAG: hypothetical protein SOT60_09335 [Bilifractor sp.]|nr:hypothetical protein [Lachnospiraceae bacterium]MDY2838122.1 hypothetical protein [Bilifractor sp.]
MEKLSDLKEYISGKKKGYGTAYYGTINGETIYLSAGIREIYFVGSEFQSIINYVTRFQKGDFGDAPARGKAEKPGHEYGCYPGKLEGDNGEDTSVWIHRDAEAVIVYFAFER